MRLIRVKWGKLPGEVFLALLFKAFLMFLYLNV
jgi:hypothetical protein